MFKSKIAENILAEHLINNGAVSFLTERPMRLKSGLITPIYVDNRRLTAVPEAWRDILETMATKVVELGLEFDIVAGVEGAGVSHAAALAYRLNKPSIFVRQAAKTAMIRKSTFYKHFADKYELLAFIVKEVIND